MQRIYHVNVNCSDLERSLAFYRDGLGLSTLTRTTPTEPQPGAAFGLDLVQWDAWILTGDRGHAGAVLDLLEWKVPPPASRPRTRATDVGFNRLAISVPDLDAAYERVRALGASCRTEPRAIDFGGIVVRAFVCGDPDGTQLSVVEGDEVRLVHITVNCAHLDESVRFYRDVMGLQPGRAIDPPPLPGELFGLDGEVDLRLQLMRDPVSGFAVELVEWRRPRITSWGFRKANDLGIFRMAWLTDDIDRDYARLLAAGVCCYTPPAELRMGPGIPDLRALFFDDPDAVCLELIESGAR